MQTTEEIESKPRQKNPNGEHIWDKLGYTLGEWVALPPQLRIRKENEAYEGVPDVPANVPMADQVAEIARNLKRIKEEDEGKVSPIVDIGVKKSQTVENITQDFSYFKRREAEIKAERDKNLEIFQKEAIYTQQNKNHNTELEDDDFCYMYGI